MAQRYVKSKFGDLETFKLLRILGILETRSHGHGRYASIQATSIVQFKIKILGLLRSLSVCSML